MIRITTKQLNKDTYAKLDYRNIFDPLFEPNINYMFHFKTFCVIFCWWFFALYFLFLNGSFYAVFSPMYIFTFLVRVIKSFSVWNWLCGIRYMLLKIDGVLIIILGSYTILQLKCNLRYAKIISFIPSQFCISFDGYETGYWTSFHLILFCNNTKYVNN